MFEYILPNSKAQNQSVLKRLSCFQGKGKINVSVPSGAINRSKSIDFTKNASEYWTAILKAKQDSTKRWTQEQRYYSFDYHNKEGLIIYTCA